MEKKIILNNVFRKTNFGFIVDWKRYKNNNFYSAFAPYLIKAIIEEFRPIIISSQKDYNRNKFRINKLISLELGVPQIKLDTKLNCKKLLFHSDPHFEIEKRHKYFLLNEFDYILSFYHSPFFYHNPDFDKNKFIHFPWAVPDEMINREQILLRNDNVVIFGGKKSDAYDIRNWCREKQGILSYDNSGVENKQLSNENYYYWLRNFDAIIAAGSSNPKFDLVTPKYFEIAASGALLFAQHCKDLEILGFNASNSIIFKKDTFEEKVAEYKNNPEKYLETRKRGRDLILQKHKLSDRISLLKKILDE